MEKDILKSRIANLYSLDSLLVLLNEVEESKERIITLDSLRYYSNPNRTYKRFYAFAIKKRNGTKRTIYSPHIHLKEIQHRLNIIFQTLYTPSEFATGFTKGKNVIINAKRHTNKNYVFNIDLKDFFTNIPQARIWKRLQLPPFNFKMPIVNAIAGLCCIKIFPSEHTEKNKVCYVLPQGAPTSPILSNAICDTLDRRLNGLAKRFNATYTRYADDISFSSMHNIYNLDSEFIQELYRIVDEQGFIVNHSKTRLQKNGCRQEVTGLTVCKKINVNRKFVSSIRQLLYIWNKYGLIEAEKCYKKYLEKNNTIIKKTPNLPSVMKGKIEFIRMVKGDSDSTYQSLLHKYEQALLKKGIIFLKTQTFNEFETRNGNICFVNDNNGHRYAYYKKRGKYIKLLSISSKINIKNLDKNTLYISKCMREDTSIFFLIHKTPRPNFDTSS